MTDPQDARERRRQFVRRNLAWLIPLGVTAGTGFLIGLGFLVAWLWRVTLGDIFGLKPISFWQAWGLILLSQILFKANVQTTGRTRAMRRCSSANAEPPATESK